MFKNNLKRTILILTLILLMLCPFVFAEDEEIQNTDDEYAIQLINEVPADSSEEGVTIVPEGILTDLPPSENQAESIENKTQKNDVYLIGDNVKVDYIIDGNLYVIANTVSIESQVIGNVFVCANKLDITSQGYISSSVYVASSNINIDGIAYDVYATSQNLTISGYIYRDVYAASKNINILGTIGRNANITTNNLSFGTSNVSSNNVDNEDFVNVTSQGKIIGNLNYSAPSEIEIPERIVDGEIKYEQQIVNNNDYLGSAITFVILTIIVWLLLKWLAPKFIEKSENLLKTKPLPIIGFGLLGLIAMPIIAIALILLNVTSTIGLLFLAIYFILICISTAVFVISINNIICSKLKLDKTLKKFGLLIAVTIVAWLLTIIPYAGTVINLIYIILGLGIIVRIILPKKEKEKKK